MTIALRRKGALFVISAPSGGGKSAAIRALLEREKGIRYSVSVTSRKARSGEREGQDYCFVSTEEFQRMIERKEFYEWAKVHGNFYGTRKTTVEALLAQGDDVAMDLDVQGACAVKGSRPESVTIFLLPPSMEILEKRLRGRVTDDEEVIQLRLRNAADEVAQCRLFDYLVLNDDLGRAVEEIGAIVEAERHRSLRQELLLENEPAVETRITPLPRHSSH
ncbi:guanylate kinase [Candidatus Sumerlaeota bacterium]|nr:guanylate kinase [Candidatus Sumerlaeota bacterium]